MNKSYKLIEEKRNKDRVVESIKYEIRKYIKREKNKPLPEDVDFWKLECKISKDSDELAFVEFQNLIRTIDILVLEEAESLNIEILSFEGIKKPKEIVAQDELTEENTEGKKEVI
jgi:hypothetical protein